MPRILNIARFPRLARVVIVSLALPILISACQRVPLLAPTGSTITLTASATALPANGTMQLIVQIIEASGTPPHSGTHVIFTTTLGTIEPSETQTDINGRATATFKANGANGTATITASSGGAVVAAANALKIALGTAAVGSLTLNASPTTIPATGGSSTIRAIVFDTSGNVLAGVPVTFTTDVGAVSPSSVTTDANGVAAATLTTSRTAKVTATAGISTTSGTTTTAAPSKDVTVTVNSVNTISVGAVTPANPTAGQTVSIALTYGTGASPITGLKVDWGDGSNSTFGGQPAAISHRYDRAGSYLVVVTGTDSFGDSSTASTAVNVTARAKPTVTVSAPDNTTPNTPTKITITATPTTGNTITSVFVDFGDNTSQTFSGSVSSVQHIYTSGGSYTITATATDSSGESGSGSTGIFVNGAVNATFTATNGAAGSKQVTFNASGSSSPNGSITSYQWDFGDGTTGSGLSVTKTYGSTTPVTVTLTVTDSTGKSATTTRTVTPP